jgi:hypothetical protein
LVLDVPDLSLATTPRRSTSCMLSFSGVGLAGASPSRPGAKKCDGSVAGPNLTLETGGFGDIWRRCE